jgi:hypothetical protein
MLKRVLLEVLLNPEDGAFDRMTDEQTMLRLKHALFTGLPYINGDEMKVELYKCEATATETEQWFFILSVHRTAESRVCVWWRPEAMGYTTSIGEAGRYRRLEALQHSDPPHHLAIPCDAVEVPASLSKRFAKKALSGSRFERPCAQCGALPGHACDCAGSNPIRSTP